MEILKQHIREIGHFKDLAISKSKEENKPLTITG